MTNITFLFTLYHSLYYPKHLDKSSKMTDCINANKCHMDLVGVARVQRNVLYIVARPHVL